MTLYACPLCQAPLTRREQAYFCPQQHHFDFARDGYVHLLPVQHKHSRQPGDTPAMMAARRHFFDQGHYAPLRQAVTAHLQALLTDTLPPAVLDVGTGEGYYAGGLRAALPEHIAVYGLDISKAAIQAAARRYRTCHFAVAGSHRLPFVTGGFAHLLNIFAPLDSSEAQRVLAPGGSLLRVSPAPGHLFAIKALLYPEPRQHADEAAVREDWVLQHETRLTYAFEISQGADLEALIHMTPYAWRLEHLPPQRLSEVLPLTVEVDVWLRSYGVAG
ncbi:MAG: putative RNA methyltransferase [Candidatus Sericytochromatia bacterium]